MTRWISSKADLEQHIFPDIEACIYLRNANIDHFSKRNDDYSFLTPEFTDAHCVENLNNLLQKKRKKWCKELRKNLSEKYYPARKSNMKIIFWKKKGGIFSHFCTYVYGLPHFLNVIFSKMGKKSLKLPHVIFGWSYYKNCSCN